MTDPFALILSVDAGIGLGIAFFVGLWWTVRRGMASPQPALWFVGSLVVRVGLAVTVFALAGLGGRWERMLACLFGFVVTHVLATRLGAGGPDAPRS